MRKKSTNHTRISPKGQRPRNEAACSNKPEDGFGLTPKGIKGHGFHGQNLKGKYLAGISWMAQALEMNLRRRLGRLLKAKVQRNVACASRN